MPITVPNNEKTLNKDINFFLYTACERALTLNQPHLPFLTENVV